MSFASEPIGYTSGSKSIKLSNTGKASLAIGAIATTGDFVATNTCGSNLAAGSNCSIAIRFAPKATGSRSGTLTITDNASGSPQTASLSGTGVFPVKLSATSMAFASTKVGRTSSSKSLTVTNNQPVAISLSIGMAGTNPRDFAIASSTTCTATLAADSNCVYTLTFAPAAAGSRSASLAIADNPDPNDPYLINLSGTGR